MSENNYGHKHVHVYSPGAGVDNPLGSIFKTHLNNQSWHCRKISQGQTRVIIYINFVELQSLSCMPNFKIILLPFLEKKILKGHCGHLGHVTWFGGLLFSS